MFRSVFMLLLWSCTLCPAQTLIPYQQQEGEEHQRQAEEYFESLHVVPQGFNWRIVNQHVRDARVERIRMRKDEQVQADTQKVKGLWKEIGSINQAGRIVSVDLDLNTNRVWVAGDGGTIWEGNTSGSSWKILNETQRIDYPRIVKHITMSDGTDRLVVVANSPRAYTLDEGETLWNKSIGLDDMARWGGFSRVVSCERDGRIEIVGIGYEWDYSAEWRSRGVIYRSIDSGASFAKVGWVDGVQTLWTDGGENVFVVIADTLAKLNADASITQIGLLPSQSNVRSVIIAGEQTYSLMLGITSIYYEGAKRTDSTHFYISYDEGLNWERRGAVAFGPFESRSFCQIANDASTWLFGGMEVFRSSDEGHSWSAINGWGEYYGNPENKLHADIPSLSSFPLPNQASLTFVCTDGGIYKSTNGCETVKNISLRNLNVSQYYGSYTNRDNVAVVSAGAQDQGFQRSITDTAKGAREFQQMISGDYASLVSGDDGQTLFTVYPTFTLFIPEAETGWGAIGKEFPHKGQMWLPPLAIDPQTPYKAYLGGGTRSKGAYVYTYSYAGTELNVDSLPFDFGEGMSDVHITAVAISRINPQYRYVITNVNVMWASTNGGQTWEKNNTSPELDGQYWSGNAIAIDPNNSSRVYIGGTGYSVPGVFVTEDEGKSFTGLDGLPPCLVIGVAVTDNGRFVAAATDAGAFVYDTATHIWTDINEYGGPDQTYWHVDWVPPLGVFRFSTYGRGLWDFTPDLTLGVSESNRPNHQHSLSIRVRGLSPAIEIETIAGGAATAYFYDLLGRLVHSLSLNLTSGTQSYDVPSAARSATMVVLVHADGRVAACAMH